MTTTHAGPAPDPTRQAIAVLDEIIAANQEARENLLAILAQFDLAPERLVTADSMEAGGWLRLPGEQRWRQLAAVTVCNTTGEWRRCRMLTFRDGAHQVHVDPATTYPYLTEAEMADHEEQVAA